MKSCERSYAHWTPRYLLNRIREIIHQKIHPDDPWLTPDAVKVLRSWLKKTDVGLEFGSGRSTLFFAQHVSRLTSVEHDPFWYELITKKMKGGRVSNVEYLLCELNGDEEQARNDAPYIQVANRFEVQSLDFVLVDGAYRGACANAVIELIRPGGIIIVDNANWFLPSNTYSPTSRNFEQGPNGKEWSNFFKTVKDWRWIWTSSGVTDTLIIFTPC